MALDAKTLGEAIAGKLFEGIDGKIRNGMTEAERDSCKENLSAIWTAIAAEIVSHITSCAEVTVKAGIAVSTSGTAASQIGQTTASGTGSIT